MKVKMKSRNLLMFLLLVTVLVLFSNILGVYLFSSSEPSGFVARDDLLEDTSDFVSSTNFTVQRDAIHSIKFIVSDSSTDSLYGETSGISRQLTEENRTKKSSTLDEFFIRQVINTIPKNDVEKGKEGLTEAKVNKSISIGGRENVVKQPIRGRQRNENEKMEIKQFPQSSIKVNSVNKVRNQREHSIKPNAQVRQIKDLLIQGKLYLSLFATQSDPHFVKDLRLRMKEATETLGSAINDSELKTNAPEKAKALERTLLKGKQIQDECAAVVKKLRAMLVSTDEQLRMNAKQAVYLINIAAKTIPKGLHCLALRLSIEYFMLNSSQHDFPNKEKLVDPELFHYALFSDNILAAAVVVNSTLTHAKDPSKHVFHVVTDGLNFAPMRMWFLSNPPGQATINVENVETFSWLNASYSPVLKQLETPTMIDFYYKSHHAQLDPNVKYRNPKYLSIMNHLRFYLQEIFPRLDKILFLDDDVVVQKDLTPLWSIDLKQKVIGVVETCGESFHRFNRYLNFSNPLISRSFDPHACGWAFGMNIIDLKEWRRQNITDIYHKWQNLNQDRLLWKLGTLPPGLITFWNRTYPLEKSWHVLGLGYNRNVPQKDIDRAAVIHYNGNLKPWLEIGIPKFKDYWTKYVHHEQKYLRECNIS